MEKIIKAAVERGASDLHIKAGDVFRARINGKLVPLTKQRLTPDQTKSIALKLISSEEDRARIDRIRDFDCSWGMPGVGRFRVNVLRQRSSFMIVMRVIPFAVPTIESLGLPEVLKQIAESERGMVLVSGVSGSGKSSTVAAMVHHINRTLHKHVVTIENPIEFLHRDLSCSITQREVGVDTDGLVVGLRAALRQDPDVVVLGDMGDAPTIDTALKAAETGRLVIGTIATPDVVATVERVLGTLPPAERDVGRMRFAEAVGSIISQQLLPKKDERRQGCGSGDPAGDPRGQGVPQRSRTTEPSQTAHGRWAERSRQPNLRAAPRGADRGRSDHRRHPKGGVGHGGKCVRQPEADEARRLLLIARCLPERHRLPKLTRRVLSTPREAGTAEAGEARAIVSSYLSQLGYTVTLQKFSFTPASLSAFPLFGAGLGGLGVVLLPFLASTGPLLGRPRGLGCRCRRSQHRCRGSRPGLGAARRSPHAKTPT